MDNYDISYKHKHSYRVKDISNYIASNLDLSDEDISEKVNDSFYKCESVKSVDRRNLNDKIISILAFIYDINFKVSLDLIKNENIVENLYSTIENKKIFKPYFEYIFKYLEER